MDARPKVIYLPDTMINWPWLRTINPHFEDVKAEVDASNPNSDLEKIDYFRIGCDYMFASCIFEWCTDTKNETVTKEIADIILDVLHNPHKIRPEGEHLIGEKVQMFWVHTIQFASLPSQRHFLETFGAHLRAVVVEARDREQGHRHSIHDYLKLWCNTIGVTPCLLIYKMGMDLPDEVFYHPVVETHASHCVIWQISLGKQATGNEGHNLISVIMLELGLDISGAMAWAAHYHAGVPSWGPLVDILVNEYFPVENLEIQHTRLVPLLPRLKRAKSYGSDMKLFPQIQALAFLVPRIFRYYTGL
ncbi:hypothetical protein EV424DRAFT_1470338 [Suillus variegatus]|nr:hypothetical protein EV424DRAFT_1470338 [Suillus variegatus]